MKRVRKRMGSSKQITAGTLAAIMLGGVCLTQADQGLVPSYPDAHQFVVPGDVDVDQLTTNEEVALGYDTYWTDQNGNDLGDGIDLAMVCAQVIQKLPEADPNEAIHEPYKVTHAMRGLVNCGVCGEAINMGTVDVVNPELNLTLNIPILSLHTMEHGSFTYTSDLHQGRVDVPRLVRLLDLHYPEEPNEHQLIPEQTDQDGDLITDVEELALGLDLYDDDQNQNLITDGIELGKKCAQAIEELPLYTGLEDCDCIPTTPYKVYFATLGFESCEICGSRMDMGYYEVINPQLEKSTQVYLMGCHYLEHGCFDYSGSRNQGRIDLATLLEILEMDDTCGDLKPPSDANEWLPVL